MVPELMIFNLSKRTGDCSSVDRGAVYCIDFEIISHEYSSIKTLKTYATMVIISL